jgi:hypothetical protein
MFLLLAKVRVAGNLIQTSDFAKSDTCWFARKNDLLNLVA